MRTLIEGMIDFRKNQQHCYRKAYSHLAEGQSPEVLLITCSDSRVAPHIFASSDPGEVFVIRNMGNIIPEESIASSRNFSAEASSIEFSLSALPIRDVIVCGHSGCGAMYKLLQGLDQEPPSVRNWLNCCGCTLTMLPEFPFLSSTLEPVNKLVQMNVLKQIEHLKTYPIIQKKVDAGELTLHAWYYNIPKGDVYHFVEEKKEFVLIDEEEGLRMLANLD